MQPRAAGNGSQIHPGTVKGETLTISIGVIIQYPLSEAAHDGDAARAIRNRLNVVWLGEPAGESVPVFTDRFSQTAALLADEGAQLGSWGSNLGPRKRSRRCRGGLGYRAAQVAHDRAGSAESVGHAQHCRKDELAAFGGRFPAFKTQPLQPE